VGDFEYLKEDEDATGVGADIFVRKKKPGPAVGVGYYVDIYESGVKINSVEARTKKDVKQILDEYKSKYNTLRSFEIESQQHITYKTKEERGEEPPKKPEEEKKPETEVTTERGETAMNTIDQVLLKKASIIETMLTRLKYPTLPIRKWAETAVGQGNVDLFPETPPEAGVTDETVVDEKTTANKIVKKLIEYVQNNAQKPVDELYNGIKHWISIVKKKMKEWEKMSGQPLDRKMIAEQIKNAVTSGDAAVIKQVSGLDVTPEVAAALQKVTLMEIGSAQDSGVLAESIGKAASLDDDVAKVVGIVSKAPESEAKFEAAQALKETFGDSIPDIVQMLPETFHGKAVEKAIMEMEQDAANKSDSISTTAVNPTSMNPTVEISIKAFWEYAYRAKKTASLETLFEEWVNKEKIELEQARLLLTGVYKDVNALFRNKSALISADSLLDILISGPKNVTVYYGWIKLDDSLNIGGMLGKTFIAEHKDGDERISAELDAFFRGEVQKEGSPFKVPNDVFNKTIVKEYDKTFKGAKQNLAFIAKATYTLKMLIIQNMKDRFPIMYGALVTSLVHNQNEKARISFTDYDGTLSVFYARWRGSALAISPEEEEQAVSSGVQESEPTGTTENQSIIKEQS
jgi:hypothetical protein